jgi:MFS transporter, SP family, general alpha glucoside:H+ symporter
MAETLPKPDAKHAELQHDEALIVEAKQAAASEQDMSLLQAIKTYPKAIGWSVLLSSTLIMEGMCFCWLILHLSRGWRVSSSGYDLALLGSLYASDVFNQKFGSFNAENDSWNVSAAWQSGLSNGARAGEIIGLIIAGWTADRFGYRNTTIGFLGLMIAFIFVLFFAPNVQVLVVGEVLCGIPWGAFQSVTPYVIL